ncbi:hypothetical protein R6Q59_020148 [Mikania micrantha]
MSIQKLIDDEVINCNGVPLKDEMIQLSTTTPFMDPAKFVWACIGDATTNQIFFENLFLGAKEAADHIICSSIIDLEPGTFTLFPKMLPIGPLLASGGSRNFFQWVHHFSTF